MPRVAVGPVSRLAFHKVEEHLLGRTPRVVDTLDQSGGRVPEHERPTPFGVRRGEVQRERAAVGEPDDRGLLAARGIHHRDDVLHLGLQVGQPVERHRIREAGPPAVEHDQTPDGRQSSALAGELGNGPEPLDVVDPAPDLDDVERALAELLIREVNLSVSGVPGLRGRVHVQSFAESPDHRPRGVGPMLSPPRRSTGAPKTADLRARTGPGERPRRAVLGC